VPTKENATQRKELADAVLGALPIFHTHVMEMSQFYDSTAVVTDGQPAPQPDLQQLLGRDFDAR
jgi:hypothetical protein